MNNAHPQVEPRSATVAALAAAIPHGTVHGDGHTTVSGITFDSREAAPGILFAALCGADCDGHAFIHSAIERGAVAILAEKVVTEAVPTILTDDSRASLAPLATAFYGDPSRDLTMIGLTGTDGKTTTSFLTQHILTTTGTQTGLIGTAGIEIGDGTSHCLPHQTTPESSLVQGYLREMLEHGTRAAVLEATSHGLAMHRLDGTTFTIAGVTNITHDHLEFHGTIENYRRAKAMLVERVAAVQGTVVVNQDDAGAASLAPYVAGAALVWYSRTNPAADLYADDIRLGTQGSRFTLVAAGERVQVELPLLGAFNIDNALCALGVSRAAGVPLDAAVAALATATCAPGRTAQLRQGQPFSVMVDNAHTPNSMHTILELLRGLHPDGRLISVFGSAGERDVVKRPLLGALAVTIGDIAIITSEDPRNEDADEIIHQIRAGAVEAGGVLGENVFEVTDRAAAIRQAFRRAQPGDCVAILGKGSESSIIWGFEHRPWSDEVAARAELAALGYTEGYRASPGC